MIYRLLSGKHTRFEDGVRVRYIGQNLKPKGQAGDLIDLSEREAFAMRTRIATTEGLKIEPRQPVAKALQKRIDAGARARQQRLAQEAGVEAGGEALAEAGEEGDESADDTQVDVVDSNARAAREAREAREARAARTPRTSRSSARSGGKRGRKSNSRSSARAAGAASKGGAEASEEAQSETNEGANEETAAEAPARPERVSKPGYTVEAAPDTNGEGFNVVSMADGQPVNGEPLSKADAISLARELGGSEQAEA